MEVVVGRNKVNQGRKMLIVAKIQSSVLYYISEFEKLNTMNQIMPKTIKGSWKPPPNDIHTRSMLMVLSTHILEQEDGEL